MTRYMIREPSQIWLADFISTNGSFSATFGSNRGNVVDIPLNIGDLFQRVRAALPQAVVIQGTKIRPNETAAIGAVIEITTADRSRFFQIGQLEPFLKNLTQVNAAGGDPIGDSDNLARQKKAEVRARSDVGALLRPVRERIKKGRITSKEDLAELNSLKTSAGATLASLKIASNIKLTSNETNALQEQGINTQALRKGDIGPLLSPEPQAGIAGAGLGVGIALLVGLFALSSRKS